MQVTEGDDYYLGRVLINAQIAASLRSSKKLDSNHAQFAAPLLLSKEYT